MNNRSEGENRNHPEDLGRIVKALEAEREQFNKIWNYRQYIKEAIFTVAEERAPGTLVINDFMRPVRYEEVWALNKAAIALENELKSAVKKDISFEDSFNKTQEYLRVFGASTTKEKQAETSRTLILITMLLPLQMILRSMSSDFNFLESESTVILLSTILATLLTLPILEYNYRVFGVSKEETLRVVGRTFMRLPIQHRVNKELHTKGLRLGNILSARNARKIHYSPDSVEAAKRDADYYGIMRSKIIDVYTAPLVEMNATLAKKVDHLKTQQDSINSDQQLDTKDRDSLLEQITRDIEDLEDQIQKNTTTINNHESKIEADSIGAELKHKIRHEQKTKEDHLQRIKDKVGSVVGDVQSAQELEAAYEAEDIV